MKFRSKNNIDILHLVCICFCLWRKWEYILAGTHISIPRIHVYKQAVSNTMQYLSLLFNTCRAMKMKAKRNYTYVVCTYIVYLFLLEPKDREPRNSTNSSTMNTRTPQPWNYIQILKLKKEKIKKFPYYICMCMLMPKNMAMAWRKFLGSILLGIHSESFYTEIGK
jgi:hypothetical protein